MKSCTIKTFIKNFVRKLIILKNWKSFTFYTNIVAEILMKNSFRLNKPIYGYTLRS